MSENANDTTAPSTSRSTASSLAARTTPDEPPPPVARHAQPHLRPAACESTEIGRLLQHSVEPRRRHLEAAIVDALHLQHPLQLAGDALAIGERHPRPAGAFARAVLGAVDEYAELPAVVGKLDVDELVPQPDGCRFNDLADVQYPRHKQKMGTRPIP